MQMRALSETLKQVGSALLALLIISIVTFAATSIRSPEAVAMNALGREASTDAINNFIIQNGLDQPLVFRFLTWLWHFVRLDWGMSAVNNRPVSEVVIPWISNTLALSVVALALALPISVWLGLLMAKKWGTATDVGLLSLTVILAGIPEFVVAIILMFVFALCLGLVPVDSTLADHGTVLERIQAYVLPTLTLVVVMVPHMSRIARASAAEALRAPFIKAAILRGMSRSIVLWDYAMRSAAVPFVNAVGINVVYLLSGVVVIENVFAFPGIGRLLVQAVASGDTNVVQAIAVVMGTLFLAISFVCDLLVIYFNPKLRRRKGSA
ncbi:MULTISPECIES: ABC transporter permease [unclassified Mesorhizobium]|uniref:ABC transporter permease n=1 Tax=unclassified Mesorhizobium TaxID=325217 RepID=UPI001092A709|nr:MULTISPECIES: ABC transporter permease [unclassified Mesorhizobium]TGV15134.1 ABC transporter permease [Mesorhizobium sp. M8A.F.Ca.ET.173.01.1.1]TGQ77271.1 ABC transporter permease [Mesorhizobium sp. M8A.F.Ca.ET.207.01.1.1]TGQ89092.1 ABC transporter permease [Mesorhizobium sp. M8A.F.Ca.ET.208.01.1.1]TGS39024.1 ABC transporter permease [Mesorhizobium sp. M8A.F.Ca.ET.182.01.1.1]TGS77305.1 ABC transporter permease [Mesorhizobium sp. M8A.F.Ca.ET.181.01.1.1]